MRYIDADKLCTYFNAVAEHAGIERLYNMAHIYKRCLQLVNEAPTEDVVPRSEVEKTKQEVAKEIIDALVKTVDDNEFPCDTHDRIMWVVNSDFITMFINGARKKYIGE